MARYFPRFLYSNPQNSKSTGPFIVHLLEPRIVFKVVFDQQEVINGINGEYSGFTGVLLLDKVPYTKKIQGIAVAAVTWFEGNLEDGQLDIRKMDVMKHHFSKL